MFDIAKLDTHTLQEKGLPMTDPEARELIYGMPYKQWQALYQKEATAEQKAKFAAANPGH